MADGKRYRTVLRQRRASKLLTLYPGNERDDRMEAGMERLDPLPQGITGFDVPSEVLSIPGSRFKAACYAVARSMGGQVTSFLERERRHEGNHHSAVLGMQENAVSVLCNHAYPFLAFVPPDAYEARRLVFLPPGGLGQRFTELTEFRPLDPAFLAGPLAPEVLGTVLKDLGPFELKQLRRWMKGSIASCIGNVVFNFWD